MTKYSAIEFFAALKMARFNHRTGGECAATNALKSFAVASGGVFFKMYMAFKDHSEHVYLAACSGTEPIKPEPELSDFVTVKTVSSVRAADNDTLKAYIKQHAHTAVFMKEWELTPTISEESIQEFKDTSVYDSRIERAKVFRDLVIYLPSKGNTGMAYVTKAKRNRIDAFDTPARLTAYLLKYYY